MLRFSIVWTVVAAIVAPAAAQEKLTREQKVRNDRREIESDGFWVYNDLQSAAAKARETGKPLLVVLRCIPCENCAQLDEQVVERDPTVRALLDEFVCARIVHANGLDLSLFQYDYDQSFAAFLMNGDLTIYGRYGTRSHQSESDDDVSIEGFAKALQAALELHEQYPANKEALAAKRGPDVEFKRPELYPSLRERFGSQLNYEGNVVQSCIHCHQVGEAQRHVHRDAGRPIPADVLYPYPHPKIFGLIMDPKEKAVVQRVEPDSPAADDGFRAGDEILHLAGQPLLSIADMQWVLHHAPESGAVAAKVRRGDKLIDTQLTLADGWRQSGDISWRATSWDLRRMATGGMRLEPLPDEDRSRRRLDESSLALLVKHVGQFGDHAVAKKAGFLKDDVIVEVDGRSEPLTESDLLAYVVNHKKPGEKIDMTVLRGGKRLQLSFAAQ